MKVNYGKIFAAGVMATLAYINANLMVGFCIEGECWLFLGTAIAALFCLGGTIEYLCSAFVFKKAKKKYL